MFTQPTQIPRSPFASTLTVVFHSFLVLVAMVLSAVPNIPTIIRRESLVYVNTAAPPDIDFAPPAPTPAPPEEPLLPLERPEPPPVSEAPPLVKPPAPQPPPVEQKAFERPPQPPPVPRIPPVIVGGFSDVPATAAATRPTGITTAGFDAAAAQAGQGRRTLAPVDGFETNGTGPRTSRATLVADAGFGAASRSDERKVARAQGATGFAADESPRAPVQQARVTGASGFAEQPAAPAAPAAPPPTTQSSGFAVTPAPAKPSAPPPKAAGAERPVEVLHKPTPAYTEEARARHIEGEVTLEVEFTAGGQVRILRVIRGLGYGLDEMAQKAAEQIRFKPATSNGAAIDTRATLTIVFRLT